MMGLLGRERSLTISLAVWTQSSNITDRRTPGESKDHAYKGEGSSLDIAPHTILNSGALQHRKWQLIGTGCSIAAQASGCP